MINSEHLKLRLAVSIRIYDPSDSGSILTGVPMRSYGIHREKLERYEGKTGRVGVVTFHVKTYMHPNVMPVYFPYFR